LIALDQVANLDRDARIFTDRRSWTDSFCGQTAGAPGAVVASIDRMCVWGSAQVSTHRKLRFARAGVYSLL